MYSTSGTELWILTPKQGALIQWCVICLFTDSPSPLALNSVQLISSRELWW